MKGGAKKAKTQKTALVVDDNPTVRSEVRDLFLSDGFTLCVEAANGLEAIEAVKQRQPDVIILDAAMPIMNGLEAATKLRILCPDVPIILFTLHGDIFKQQNLASFGISAVCTKGHGGDDLLKKVHDLMRKDSGSRE